MCCFNIADRKERLVLARKDAIVAYKIMYRIPGLVPRSLYNTHQRWYKNKTVKAKGGNGRAVKNPTYAGRTAAGVVPGTSKVGIYSYNRAGMDGMDGLTQNLDAWGWQNYRVIPVKVKIWGVVDVYRGGYLSTRATRIG